MKSRLQSADHMLASSFVLLKGIGQSSERRLWQEGILDWATFLRSPALPGISSTRKEWYDRELATAQSRLEDGDAHFFGTCLKSREHWRLFETFRHRALYLDIERSEEHTSELQSRGHLV